MAQSIYSVLLQECLVEAVDALAEDKQMSRSQIINEILSERFEMFTPDYKSNQIMDIVSERLNGNERLHLISIAKGSSIQYRMKVPFKYNPKIRLMMIMNSKDSDCVATLKITSRTTNKAFKACLWQFFKAQNEVTMEHDRLSTYPMLLDAFMDGEAIVKRFPVKWTEDHMTIEEIARELTNYMYMITDAIVSYFESIEDPDFGVEEMERLIHKYF